MRFVRVYIDGYNVLHTLPRLVSLLRTDPDAARRSLVETLRTEHAGKGALTVVFDGHGEPISGAGMRVVFSSVRSADAWIRERLEEDPRPRASLVVSSDNAVRAHAAAMGAAVMTAEEYLDRRSATRRPSDEKPGNRLSAAEIEEWKRLFSEGELESPP